MKNEGKNKSVAFIILFSVYIYNSAKYGLRVHEQIMTAFIIIIISKLII